MPDDREYLDEIDEPTREAMRPQGIGPQRKRPSTDDIKVRRRQRRAAAAQEESAVTTPDRGEILRAIATAPTLKRQGELVALLDEFDLRTAARKALENEVDWSAMTVQKTLQPVAVYSRSTPASDWLADLADPEVDQVAIVAQAARWFGQLSPEVRADAGECAEQALGLARRLASSYGEAAEEVEQIFTSYTAFLQHQSASGLDQVQQTVAPDGTTQKATPLPQDVFDNFAPPVDPVNSGVVGTETSERSPMLQEISGGGGNSTPEVPGGHSTGNDGVQSGGGGGDGSTALHADSGGSSAPEQAGGHSEGNEEPRRAQAASGLPQIQQTVDVHDGSSTTPLPTTVAFPWELGDEDQDGMTGEAHYDQGGEVPSRHTTAALQVTADQWTPPHRTVGPQIANSPATTPQAAPGTAAQGRSDAASPEAAATFADAHAAPAYTQAYTDNAPGPQEHNVPASMGGDNGQAQHHPSFVPDMPVSVAPRFASRHVASAEDMEAPDFQRGYRYAARWKPGTPLVAQGSPELEAGIYAGITDRAEYRGAWLDAHRRVAVKEPYLGRRIALHRQLTEQVAGEQGLVTDGTYLSVQAATSTDLDTTAPGTSPSPTGQTPVNGPGQPGPLAGVQEAAVAGGPSPYNGAQPMGSPVVPAAGTAPGVAQTIPSEGMSPPQRSMSPVSAAFRRTVQATKLTERNKG